MNKTLGCLGVALALAAVGCTGSLVPPKPPGPLAQPTTTAYGLLARAPGTITWERSGGFAGMCQTLVIWSDGSYILDDTCRSSGRRTGSLPSSELSQLQAWLATYQPFDWAPSVPPGSADMFVDHLQFNGDGQEPAPLALQAQISDHISGIVSRLMVNDIATPPSDAAQQGVKGKAVIGPMCPVMSDDNTCPDKPYQGQIQVLDPSGDVMTQFTTGADGSFQVPLPAGSYVLRGVRQGPFPGAPPLEVTVRPGEYVQVTLTFDSGIR